MQLGTDLHLAYCTNIHAGESWPATLTSLEQFVLPVRDRVSPAGEPYAIGLRLGAQTAEDLHGGELEAFRGWLERHNCYVFTINGFPYGSFHGKRVKEQVYAPDWAMPERLGYTLRLFDILSAILPTGIDGSVSTVPVSFKAFASDGDHRAEVIKHLRHCADSLERICDQTGQDLHLALEPEPLCTIETTAEAVDFFDTLVDGLHSGGAERLRRRIGINYDTCHLACEFEESTEALDRLYDNGIRIGKLHLSSALRLVDPQRHHAALATFAEPVYLHQVIGARDGKVIFRLPDLTDALDRARKPGFDCGEEWRVHFHIPLHAAPAPPLGDTRDHLRGALDWLRDHPGSCHHLEMETYTWGVLPGELKSQSVVDQLCREYDWTLAELAERGLAPQRTA